MLGSRPASTLRIHNECSAGAEAARDRVPGLRIFFLPPSSGRDGSLGAWAQQSCHQGPFGIEHRKSLTKAPFLQVSGVPQKYRA